MSVALQLTQNFTRLECGECGINFWVPDHFDDQRREDKRGWYWYCPNGHYRVYKESEADRLRKQLADKQRELERANQALEEAWLGGTRQALERACAVVRTWDVEVADVRILSPQSIGQQALAAVREAIAGQIEKLDVKWSPER